MSKFSLSILSIAVLAIAITTAITGCSGIFDAIADTVLANEVRFDDREVPRTAYAISASADEVQLVGGARQRPELQPAAWHAGVGIHPREQTSTYCVANAPSLCLP